MHGMKANRRGRNRRAQGWAHNHFRAYAQVKNGHPGKLRAFSTSVSHPLATPLKHHSGSVGHSGEGEGAGLGEGTGLGGGSGDPAGCGLGESNGAGEGLGESVGGRGTGLRAAGEIR